MLRTGGILLCLAYLGRQDQATEFFEFLHVTDRGAILTDGYQGFAPRGAVEKLRLSCSEIHSVRHRSSIGWPDCVEVSGALHADIVVLQPVHIVL